MGYIHRQLDIILLGQLRIINLPFGLGEARTDVYCWKVDLPYSLCEKIMVANVVLVCPAYFFFFVVSLFFFFSVVSCCWLVHQASCCKTSAVSIQWLDESMWSFRWSFRRHVLLYFPTEDLPMIQDDGFYFCVVLFVGCVDFFRSLISAIASPPVLQSFGLFVATSPSSQNSSAP